MTDLLATYSAAGPGHDEMLQATGAARSAWERLAVRARLGDGEQLEQRAAEAASLLADHGAVAPDAGLDWRLDPLPVLVDEAEWSRLEAALAQRAELLDAILADLYGPRRLLTTGLLPPELVLGHAGFLRAADGIRVPGPRQLVLTGTDVARNADGSWTVIADRTQAPSGLGYAMEDRRVIAEVIAAPYRQLRIRRLGPFFRAMREALQALAPPGAGDDPRVVLLVSGTPAPFDDGYLAALLGVRMVHGQDLLVADGRVWSHSLGRREPVDVLVRRVDAADCDPLELPGGAGLGTPGLVHAARTGAVTIANHLGTGVLENPALLTYLPRLGRELLGEELALGSAATYWCGERSMCSHVIANLGRLVVKPTSPGRPGGAVRGWELTNDERADLAVRISARPWAWVGQEPVEASTTPTVDGRRLRAEPTVLRAFAVAGEDSYRVMSGALGRVTPEIDRAREHRPLAGTAKDVWVLAAEPYASAPDWPAEAAPWPRQAGGAGIAPRAARELFELGRAMERAEGTVRLLRTVADRWDDYQGARADSDGVPQHGGDGGPEALDVLLRALRSLTADLPLPSLITEAGVPGTVAHAVGQATSSARAVRDRLSADTWPPLSALERTLEREHRHRRSDADEPLGMAPVLGRILQGLLALSGVVAESMVRDLGWTLLETGRRLERSRFVVATLAATVTTARPAPVEGLVLESVLLAHESAMTHRRRYPAQPPLPGVLELLLTDRTNPHSLAFGADRLAELLPALPAEGGGALTQLIGDVTDLLAEIPTRAAEEVRTGGRTQLREALESLGWRLRTLEDEIRAVHLAVPEAATWTGEGWPS